MTPLRTQYDEVAKDATALPWQYDGECYIWAHKPIGNHVMVAEIRGAGAGLPMDTNAAIIVFAVNNFETALREIERLEAENAELRELAKWANAVLECGHPKCLESDRLMLKKYIDRFPEVRTL